MKTARSIIRMLPGGALCAMFLVCMVITRSDDIATAPVVYIDGCMDVRGTGMEK